MLSGFFHRITSHPSQGPAQPSLSPVAERYNPADPAAEENADEQQTVTPPPIARPSVAEDEDIFTILRDHQEQFRTAKNGDSRLCGDLSLLMKHVESIDTHHKHPRQCSVCGEDCYAECTGCGMTVHQPFAKKGKYCFFELHDDTKFGLCCCDQPLLGKRKRDWTPPTNDEKAANAEHIAQLKNDLHD